jgi:type 1 glutamine amidotransferase
MNLPRLFVVPARRDTASIAVSILVSLMLWAAATVAVGAEPDGDARAMRVVLLADAKDHGPSGNGTHDYPLWQKRWATLLQKATSNVSVAWDWPTDEHFQTSDVIVAYCYLDWTDQRFAQVHDYLDQGGGLVLIHSATWTKPKPSSKVAALTGVGGFQLFRHGDVRLSIESLDHPICRGLPKTVNLKNDETYWPPTPLQDSVVVLATSVEEKGARGSTPKAAQPMLWCYRLGQGRVFGCVPGHMAETFEDPVFRSLLLRGISWSAGESVERLDDLAPVLK